MIPAPELHGMSDIEQSEMKAPGRTAIRSLIVREWRELVTIKASDRPWQMPFAAPAWSPATMKLAAVASILSAFTTLELIFGARLYTQAADFAARVAMSDDPWFQLRAWTAYVHPFLCFLAAIGVWRVAKGYERGLALLALLMLGLWAYTEALQIALTNVAGAWNWFPGYADAAPPQQVLVEERWTMFLGLWDGFYFLLLTGFVLGNALFGAALVRARGFDRIVGIGFLLAAFLGIVTHFPAFAGPG